MKKAAYGTIRTTRIFNETFATLAQVSNVATVPLIAHSENGPSSFRNTSIYRAGIFADTAAPTSTFDFSFGANVDPNERDFRNTSTVNYELIVPVNFSLGVQTYFFFLDVE